MSESVTVYRVEIYDIANDAVVRSRRMATPRGAELMRGWILENTGIDIDASRLDPGREWTPRDFNPRLTVRHQTQVF